MRDTLRNQQAGENIDAYVTDLKNKASLCEFSTLKDSLIRDRIVCGIRSDKVRARLLRDPDLTLVKAIVACQAAETSQIQLKGLTEELPIDFVQKRGNFKPRQNPAKNGAAQQSHRQQPRKDPSQSYKCQRCGYTHEKKKCPAFGKKCRNCSKLNHFAKMCKRQKVHALDGTNQNDDSDWEYEQYFVELIENDLTQEKDRKIVVEISGKKLK